MKVYLAKIQAFDDGKILQYVESENAMQKWDIYHFQNTRGADWSKQV